MFHVFRNRLEITGTLTSITAFRISGGRSNEPIGSDLPVIKDSLGRPYIPGSSFKGVLRSRLESILRAIDSNYAIDPSELSSSSYVQEINKIKDQNRDNPQKLTELLLQKTDLISHLFGAPWLAAKLQICDLMVDPQTWFGQYQERDGVAIDRDTETAADGKLYDYQVVPGGVDFNFSAVVENAAQWELGLLCLGLSQLEREQILLGGGKSRGLGTVTLRIREMKWFDMTKDGENPDRGLVLNYIKKLASGAEPDWQDGREMRSSWVKQLVIKLGVE
ncbi:MAG: CRISPR-associated RAMP protein Csx7 [Pseudanabaenaceae cyanobacterium]